MPTIATSAFSATRSFCGRGRRGRWSGAACHAPWRIKRWRTPRRVIGRLTTLLGHVLDGEVRARPWRPVGA
eukprot:13642887-Heterocapsa_arctica.AAC.1